MPEAESGMNMARQAALRAGLPDIVPGVTINRFCSSGLQAIAMAADRIRSGGAEIVVAGGSESMSLIPRGGNKLAQTHRFHQGRARQCDHVHDEVAFAQRRQEFSSEERNGRECDDA